MHPLSQIFYFALVLRNIIFLLADRAENVEISVATVYGEWTVVAYQESAMGLFTSLTFDTVEARYVRVTLKDIETWMHFCEVEVYGLSKDLNSRMVVFHPFHLVS
jgi:hypothetical protein